MLRLVVLPNTCTTIIPIILSYCCCTSTRIISAVHVQQDSVIVALPLNTCRSLHSTCSAVVQQWPNITICDRHVYTLLYESYEQKGAPPLHVFAFQVLIASFFSWSQVSHLSQLPNRSYACYYTVKSKTYSTVLATLSFWAVYRGRNASSHVPPR